MVGFRQVIAPAAAASRATSDFGNVQNATLIFDEKMGYRTRPGFNIQSAMP
jgi:hypothetical protein